MALEIDSKLLWESLWDERSRGQKGKISGGLHSPSNCSILEYLDAIMTANGTAKIIWKVNRTFGVKLNRLCRGVLTRSHRLKLWSAGEET